MYSIFSHSIPFSRFYRAYVFPHILCTCILFGLIENVIGNETPIKAMTFAKINDISLYYEIHGEGEPLLLIHGGLSHAGYWHAQIEDLAKHYMVIAADSRGHGRSSLSDKPITYQLLANDFLELLNALKIESTNILGWSDGGIIALKLAIQAPDRLKKVIAYGANYHPDGVKPDVAQNVRFSQFLTRAHTDYLAMSPEPNRWSEFLKNITNMWTNEPVFSDLALKNITVPILILGGLKEEAVYPEHIKKLSEKIPQSELIMMRETGHFALQEQPNKFNKIVRNFLKKNSKN